jgi:hypothetical protein
MYSDVYAEKRWRIGPISTKYFSELLIEDVSQGDFDCLKWKIERAAKFSVPFIERNGALMILTSGVQI